MDSAQFLTSLQIVALIGTILGGVITLGMLIHSLQGVVRDVRTLRQEFNQHLQNRSLHPLVSDIREERAQAIEAAKSEQRAVTAGLKDRLDLVERTQRFHEEG